MELGLRFVSWSSLLAVLMCLTVPVATRAAKPFPIGWYDATGYYSTVGDIAESGGNIVLPYHWAGNPEYVERYLDAAQQSGLRVIVEVPRADVSSQNIAAMREFVRTHDDHPAVFGWYTADEPILSNIPVQTTQIAYAAVKQESTKPVFMAFNAEESRDRATVAYASSYDVLLFDDYPLHTDDGHFGDLGNFRGNVQRVSAQAREVGKPWWLIPQAMGRAAGTTWTYRLPTSAEQRFMTYWGVMNDAEGLLYWAHYRTKETVANPSMPYPRTGVEWIPEVWEPLAAELAEVGDGLAAGQISGMVTDNRTDILARMYHDTNANAYYLVAVNTRTGGETVTFTIDMPLEDYDLLRLDGTTMNVQAGKFTDTFSSYEVHVYRIVPEPVGLLYLGMGTMLLGRRRSMS